MEEIQKMNIKIKFKDQIKTWKFWKTIVAVLVGAIGGYLYYHFIGCESGQCAITSNPYMSVLFGAVMGLFITNSPCSRGKC